MEDVARVYRRREGLEQTVTCEDEEKEKECEKCPALKQALNTRELWWIIETRRSGVLSARQFHAPRGIAPPRQGWRSCDRSRSNIKCAIVSIRSLHNSLNLKDKIQSYLQTLFSAYPRHRNTNYKKRKKKSVSG